MGPVRKCVGRIGQHDCSSVAQNFGAALQGVRSPTRCIPRKGFRHVRGKTVIVSSTPHVETTLRRRYIIGGVHELPSSQPEFQPKAGSWR